ncbi:MAG: hypothetical protein ACRD5H_16615 [Nitrososphaerales archaeon]
MTALVSMFAIGMIFLGGIVPAAEAAKRSSYVYAKVVAESSSIDGIVAGDRIYLAWETNKPLRINVADATDQVTTATAANVVVTKSDSTLTITATLADSSIAGLHVGDVLTCSFDLVTETASCVNETTGGSVSGHSVYVNVNIVTSTRHK